MLALSLSDKFCCFSIFVFVFNFSVFVFNRFLFSHFSFHHFFVLVLVFVNEFVIFSFFTIFVFVFVNENHTVTSLEITQCLALLQTQPTQRVIKPTVIPCSDQRHGQDNTCLILSVSVAPCGLRDCKNRAHSVS